MEMDISQYKELFITEAQEHLDSLNKFLLQLESDPTNLDVVTEIFRSAHTLKGMSATMQYDQLTELAHEMENLLEHLRTGDTPVTANVVDTLFACFDTLGAIINAIAEDRPGEIDYSSLVSEIRSIVDGVVVATETPAARREMPEMRVPEKEAAPGEPEEEVEGPAGEAGPEASAAEVPEEPAPGEGAPTEPEVAAGPEAPEPEVPEEAALMEPEAEPAGVGQREGLEISEADQRKYSAVPGMRLLRLNVELDRECLLKSVRVFMVFKKLAQLGDVLASNPPVEALEDERFENNFEVGVATAETPEKIEKALLAIAEISRVTIDTILAPKAGDIQEAGAALPQEEKPQGAVRKTQSVRVNIGRLDTLMNLVGELVINRTRLAQIATGLDLPELREVLDQTARLTAELQDEVMKTRMVPVEQVFNRFPRMVRDLARAQDKEIDFVMEGREIELDRTILDEISDPLIHMLRNAVDHGIAVPDTRRSQGKPARGTVKLSAYRDRNYVVIEVADDGEGIRADQIFDLAMRKGLVSEDERRQLTPDDLLRILCMPGFSTSPEVSGISGRGVGMDAVKAKAESLGGFLVLDSDPGRGTRVILNLPLTLAIVEALMVEVSGDMYAVPLGTVRETHVINPDEIKTIQNHEAIFLRDDTIPLVRLDRALGREKEGNGGQPFPVVITEIGPRLVALGVHSLVGQQEIVINSLDKFLKKVEGFAGATILGSGRVALILDIPSLM
jgi:two-component system, chemotaxis family, sensor kinase CheA